MTLRAWLVVGMCGACSRAPDVGDTPCEPLQAQITPESLVSVRGVGEADDGTLYVIDDVGAESRAYVSDGAVLVRHRVSGSGESSEGDTTTLVLTVQAAPEPLTLGHEDSPAGVRMAVAVGLDEPRDLDEVIAAGEELSVLAPSVVAGMEAEFRREVELEYYARIDADAHVIIVRPRDDWDYDDFRLFLGPTSELTEREVHQVQRARDGGSTTIDFDYDGDDATLDSPYVDMQPGQATLEVGGSSQSIEWLDAGSFDEGAATFLCF